MSLNFTCFDSNLSRDSVTDEAWSSGDDQGQRAGVIVIGSILVLYMVVGAPWNIAVLAALIYDKFYKQPSTFLLFNLVLVDLLTCVLVMPFLAAPGLAGGVYTLGNSDYRRCQACRAGVILVIWFLYVSMHLIAVMSVDRLIYIKNPLKYDKWITVPRIAVIIVVIWIICLVLAVPPLFQFGAIEFSTNVGTCTTVFDTVTTVGPSYLYILFLVLEVMIPLGVLVVANIWLLCFVRKGIVNRFKETYQENGEATISEVNHQAKKKYHAQQIRMVKVFGSIFVSNFITWGPTIVVIFVVAGVGITNIPAGVFSLVFVCFLFQSVIHPVLESCLVGKIRKLAKMVCCFFKKKSVDISSNFKSSNHNL